MRRRSAIWTLIRMFAFSILVYGGGIFMPHKKLLVYSCHPPRPPIKPLQLWTILELEYGSRPIIDFCIGNWGNIIALHAGKVHHTHCMNKAPLKYFAYINSKSKYILLLSCKFGAMHTWSVKKATTILLKKKVDIDFTVFCLKFSLKFSLLEILSFYFKLVGFCFLQIWLQWAGEEI